MRGLIIGTAVSGGRFHFPEVRGVDIRFTEYGMLEIRKESGEVETIDIKLVAKIEVL